MRWDNGEVWDMFIKGNVIWGYIGQNEMKTIGNDSGEVMWQSVRGRINEVKVRLKESLVKYYYQHQLTTVCVLRCGFKMSYIQLSYVQLYILLKSFEFIKIKTFKTIL